MVPFKSLGAVFYSLP